MLAIDSCLFSAWAVPVASPLAPTKDALGKTLQQSVIWAPSDAKLSSSFVAFRKGFTLAGVPREASLHLFADVRYMVWINGHYVLRGPARFEPSGPEYDLMQVARFLRAGDNEVVALVMSNASNGKMRRHAPGLAARLDVDGKAALATDETWRWSDQTRYRSPDINWGNTMDRVDARVEDGDWTQPGYDDSAWKNAAKVDGTLWGPLSQRRTPLLRETEVKARLTEGQSLPMTLGANQKLTFATDRLVQAFTVLEIEADAGTEISLDYANVKYLARAGQQTYISSDTYGFFGGSISVKSGRATIRSLKLVERLYPFDVSGSFHCNDETLNKLWALCARSAQVLSEDAYVDCADRERTEWMDCDPPGFDITRTALSGTSDDGKRVYADARLLGAALRRTALTMQPEGWVKAHTASDRFDIHAKMEDRACDWVQGARRYYESTGDASLIREIWPVVVRQMNYFLERRTPRGLVLGREWEVWGNPIGYVTCEGAGLNAFIYKALVDASYLGEVIGHKPQAAAFRQAAQELAAAFNQVLWNEKEGTYFSAYYSPPDRLQADNKAREMKLKVENDLIEPTMFPALFALDQGIVPAGRRERVSRYLFAKRGQARLVMTFYYLFLQQYQADNAAFDREILDTMRRNWHEMIEWPWQTTWEDFEGGSKAHIYGMFPGYYLSAYVLGVRLEGPARGKRLVIEPRLGDLSWAQGSVVTEFGPVPVEWKVEAKRLSFRVQVPPGVKATLRIPQTGENARLTLDGKAGAGRKQGRYFVAEVAAGAHQGVVAFTKIVVPSPPLPGAPITGQSRGGSGAGFEAEVSKNDLAGLGLDTLLSLVEAAVSNDGGAKNADALRNGTTLNGAGGSQTSNDGRTYRGYGKGDVVTFNLNTAKHRRGYDISRIVTFAGHMDSRASQNYAVEVSFASDPTKFVPLFAAASVASGGGSSQLMLANPQGGVIRGDDGLKASGVASIRFGFRDGSATGGPGLGFNVYREIDLIGRPTLTP